VPKLSRGAGPVGLALTAVDVWRRLSPRQKRLIMGQAKKYGPQVAEQALRSARTAAASMRARRPK
jgi:hypothetical protein